jgi:poly(A) polymerase
MTPRQFAIDVVTKLQQAGFEALWAGGCVRDQLLGQEPKDYDIATSARPEEIRELFGNQRTLPIGAAFGVITVLGGETAGQIEVATFRRDSGYSDGRHPDAVEFTDAREDAIRRDFTINGMFYDPLAEQVIDYVGGQDDLASKIIRAIGNPHERIDEDKLRMLRGVRFAATFAFELEQDTFAAIRQHAPEIKVVSEERIGAELVRMLSHPHKSIAANHLLESQLLAEVIPDLWPKTIGWEREAWEQRFIEVERLESNEFEPVISVLLRSYFEDPTSNPVILASQLKSAWRLTNHQRDNIVWINRHWRTLTGANQTSWSQIQPLLIDANAPAALEMATAIIGSSESPRGATAGIEYCRQRLAWSPERLDPPPLLNGQDLITLGIPTGPRFKSLLQAVRDRQLDGEIETVAAAKQFVIDHARD